MDTRHPVATTVGIWNGLVVGVDDAVTELPARQEVDLGGAPVVPGFIDAHVHLAWAGTGMRRLSIRSCERIADVLRVSASAAGERGQDECLDVVGYDQRPLGRHLTVDELEAAGGGRKVFVVHDSGRACAVSSAALRLPPVDAENHQAVLAEGGMAAVRELRQPY